MISTEKVFDLLPIAVDLYEKLDFESFRKDLNPEGKTKEEIGLTAFMFILKQSGKIKKEIFEMVAVLNEKTADEIKKQPFQATVQALKEIFTEPDIADFFKQAVQSAMPKP
jgi:hypothetical protein